ncbi:hypothetical protein D3C78_1387480 [compost metagenome]
MSARCGEISVAVHRLPLAVSTCPMACHGQPSVSVTFIRSSLPKNRRVCSAVDESDGLSARAERESASGNEHSNSKTVMRIGFLPGKYGSSINTLNGNYRLN